MIPSSRKQDLKRKNLQKDFFEFQFNFASVKATPHTNYKTQKERKKERKEKERKKERKKGERKKERKKGEKKKEVNALREKRLTKRKILESVKSKYDLTTYLPSFHLGTPRKTQKI